MAPIAALWTRIVCIFDFLTNTPSQPYFSGSNVDLQVPVQPQETKYPIFYPPDDLEAIKFSCKYPDYPKKDGWVICNTNTDRQCWLRNIRTGQRFDINTDYENNGPKGVDRHYYLELGESIRNPDGFADLPAQLFNHSFPGPRLRACWGDRISITVRNTLTGDDTAENPGNGTSIHWHGFRQWNTGHMDGVNAVTQCPIAPGQEFTYVFNATQYGTSWYHSHYSLQYAAGALGPLTVYGPTSMDFDYQKEPIIMSDWLHRSVYQKWDSSIMDGAPIWIDNILQNGIGHWPPLNLSGKQESDIADDTRFNEVPFQAGKKYLLRLINGAADTTFIFSIDNHRFWVVSTDFVAIKPYQTDHIVVGIGQRYNIIVDATPDGLMADGNYWIRTTPAPQCTRFDKSAPTPDEHTGIIRYIPINDKPPTTSRQDFDLNCADETYYRNITPIVPWQVSSSRNKLDNFYLNFHQGLKQYPYWPCNKSVSRFELVSEHPMWLNFSGPTLLNLGEDFSQSPWLAEITTDVDAEAWIQLTIVSGPKSVKSPLLPHPIPKLPGVFVPGQHPIHLHGHDFAVLDQCVPTEGETACDVANAELTLDNPPRRDVAFLPNGGYLIIAFKADNPGVWIMHCHIAFHASSGLAAQIVENKAQMHLPIGWDEPFFDMCKQWDLWTPDDPSDPCKFNDPDEAPLQTDSGI